MENNLFIILTGIFSLKIRKKLQASKNVGKTRDYLIVSCGKKISKKTRTGHKFSRDGAAREPKGL